MSDQDQKQAETEQSGHEVVVEPETETETAAGAETPEPEAVAVELSNEEVVAQLAEEVAAAKDAALRAVADAQNTKRRADQEVEKARKFALERFAGDLLPVIDNLERALESAVGVGDDSKSLVEGVELTRKSLLDTLKKYNVEAISPEGEPFDPQLHQAMSMIENPDVEPNTVIAVMQKGYTLNGRLIRPAMVMVSKAAS
ncbi:MAG: nucleotide exchange factor GrpE [Halioglobus sp.]